jgi:hypothetical protein
LNAYLAFYGEYWNCLLTPEDHWHEVGENTADCRNCQAAEEAAKMSQFETACWNWYMGNVNQFTFDGGLLPEFFRSLRLKGAIRSMFLSALNSIYQTFERIKFEKIRAVQEQ